MEFKHTEASPDVFLQYALLWEKSISVGYEVLLARSLDLSISASATALEFIPPPKKQNPSRLYLEADILVGHHLVILESNYF